MPSLPARVCCASGTPATGRGDAVHGCYQRALDDAGTLGREFLVDMFMLSPKLLKEKGDEMHSKTCMLARSTCTHLPDGMAS